MKTDVGSLISHSMVVRVFVLNRWGKRSREEVAAASLRYN
jgi:hypothetical protein